jgi:hypothetical protein
MPDIHGRESAQIGGTFSVDDCKVVFAGDGSSFLGTGESGSGGVGMLVQNLQVNYARPIMRLYEIGTSFQFLMEGRSQGDSALSQLLGPRPLQTAFYQRYFNICNAATNNVNFEVSTGCGGSNKVTSTFKLRGVVLGSRSFGLNVQDMVVRDNITGIFVSLEEG